MSIVTKDVNGWQSLWQDGNCLSLPGSISSITACIGNTSTNTQERHCRILPLSSSNSSEMHSQLFAFYELSGRTTTKLKWKNMFFNHLLYFCLFLYKYIYYFILSSSYCIVENWIHTTDYYCLIFYQYSDTTRWRNNNTFGGWCFCSPVFRS